MCYGCVERAAVGACALDRRALRKRGRADQSGRSGSRAARQRAIARAVAETEARVVGGVALADGAVPAAHRLAARDVGARVLPLGEHADVGELRRRGAERRAAARDAARLAAARKDELAAGNRAVGGAARGGRGARRRRVAVARVVARKALAARAAPAARQRAARQVVALGARGVDHAHVGERRRGRNRRVGRARVGRAALLRAARLHGDARLARLAAAERDVARAAAGKAAARLAVADVVRRPALAARAAPAGQHAAACDVGARARHADHAHRRLAQRRHTRLRRTLAAALAVLARQQVRRAPAAGVVGAQLRAVAAHADRVARLGRRVLVAVALRGVARRRAPAFDKRRAVERAAAARVARARHARAQRVRVVAARALAQARAIAADAGRLAHRFPTVVRRTVAVGRARRSLHRKAARAARVARGARRTVALLAFRVAQLGRHRPIGRITAFRTRVWHQTFLASASRPKPLLFDSVLRSTTRFDFNFVRRRIKNRNNKKRCTCEIQLPVESQ